MLGAALAEARETTDTGAPSPAGVTGEAPTVSSLRCHLRDHLQGLGEPPTEEGAAEGLSQETVVATTRGSFW